MGMRLVFGLVLLGVSLGCVIPVPVTGPDAGGGAGGGGGGGEVVGGGGGGGLVEDAGSGGGGGGAIEAPCAPTSWPFQSQEDAGTVQVPLQGQNCVTSAISVTGPAGETIAPVINPTSVSFVSSTFGLYLVTIGTGASARTVQVEIVEVLPIHAGFLRTYVDRIDQCNGYWLTAEGRLVCLRADNDATVYEADGGFFDRFVGGSITAAGTAIWSFAYGNLERRVETPGGLVLEGSVRDSQYAGIAAPGESTPEKLVRGRTQFTWDGGTLSAQDPGLGYAYFLDGSKAYDQYLCEMRPGCASTPSCEPFRTCGQPVPAGLSNNGVVVAIDPERLWLARDIGGDQDLAEVRRPVDWAQPLIFRKPPRQGFGNDGKPRPFNWQVAVVAPSAGPSHFLVSTEKIIANTPQWVLTLVDPVTVRFTPVR